MKVYLLKLSLLSMVLFSIVGCNEDNDSQPTETIEYPIKLTYKEEGNSKLEYWKGGVLTEKPSSDYINYFGNNECFTYFKSETDAFCKNAEITFLDENKLTLKYGAIINLDYKFVNDTLKVTSNNNTKSLGVGNINELRIYGALRKIKTANHQSCGGDEFLKQNFDGQFFLNSNENHNLVINSPGEMQNDDEVVFYNKEYILKK